MSELENVSGITEEVKLEQRRKRASSLKKYDGKMKSAIILGTLERETAQEVMKYLSDDEKEEVARSIARLDVGDLNEVEDVVMEFLKIIKGNPSGYVESGIERVMDLLDGLVSDEQKKEITENLFREKTNLLASLSSIKDPNPLVSMLSNEEPQMIAVVAAFMRPEAAAGLLASLPSEKMASVAEGIATMGQTNPILLEKIEEKLSKKIDNFNFSDASLETNGIKNIVAVLNNVPRVVEKNLFDIMEESNPELAEKIKENLFVFEDIVMLDSRSIQKAFAVITDIELIAKAIKSTSIEVEEKIMSALPKQRREILEEELDGMGPIQKVDSEQAQQEISRIIKALENDNEIVIDRGGGDIIL